jgi:glycerol-3-phosphate acyltransferase PlsY
MILIGVLRIIILSGVNIDSIVYIRGIDILPVYGMFSIIGHVFSVFLKFKGGKGVSTSFGVILVLSPFGALGAAVGYFITLLIFAMGSLASLVGLLLADIVGVVEIILTSDKNFIKDVNYLIFFFVITVIIVIAHIKNIKRISKGTESKFKVGIPKIKEIHNFQKAKAIQIHNILFNLESSQSVNPKLLIFYLSNKKIQLVYKSKNLNLDYVVLEMINMANEVYSVSLHRRTKRHTYITVDFLQLDIT